MLRCKCNKQNELRYFPPVDKLIGRLQFAHKVGRRETPRSSHSRGQPSGRVKGKSHAANAASKPKKHRTRTLTATSVFEPQKDTPQPQKLFLRCPNTRRSSGGWQNTQSRKCGARGSHLLGPPENMASTGRRSSNWAALLYASRRMVATNHDPSTECSAYWLFHTRADPKKSRFAIHGQHRSWPNTATQ